MESMTIDRFADRLGEIMEELMQASLKDRANFFHKMKMSMSQFMMLGLLCRRGQTRMSDLARVLNVTTAAVTGIADRLVRDGYVKRSSDPKDRRVVIIGCTAKGQRVVNEMERHRKEHVIKMFGKVSEKERNDYISILEHIRSHL